MADTITFSRGKLGDFLACQRRFQLRYQRQLAWPVGPPDARQADALDRGRRFHVLLQRHLLGLPTVTPGDEDKALDHWWRLFQAQGPRLPEGRRLAEFNLTVPIGRHFLTGRFDLLIIGQDGLHIYDWKTGLRPPRPAALRDDLQTRVYLALAAEGAPALWPDSRAERIGPDRIRLTYWYANDPPESRSLDYAAAWHGENWAYLSDLVQQIADQLAGGADLPLTDDMVQCRRCAYQAFCGRQTTGLDLGEWLETGSPQLEPDLP